MPSQADLKRKLLDEWHGEPLGASKRSRDVADLMREAEEAKHSKQHGRVVEIYTTVLNSQPSAVFDVILLRCEALMMAGKYEQALRDGKHLIKLNRQMPDGYVMTAKIEARLGRFEQSVAVISRGLTIMKGSTVAEQSLKQCLTSIEAAAERDRLLKKRVNCCEILPIEIWEMISAHFSYRELVGRLRISRSWRKSLQASRTLQTILDTRCTHRPLSYHELKAAFARLGPTPTKLALGALSTGAITLLEHELSRFVRYGSIRTLILECPHFDTDVVKFDRYLNLEYLTLGRDLTIRQQAYQRLCGLATLAGPSGLCEVQLLARCTETHSVSFEQALARRSSLLCLTVDWSRWRYVGWGMQKWGQMHFDKLTSLHIVGNLNVQGPWGVTYGLDFDILPNLRHLRLESCGRGTPLHFSTLETLVLKLTGTRSSGSYIDYRSSTDHLRGCVLDGSQWSTPYDSNMTDLLVTILQAPQLRALAILDLVPLSQLIRVLMILADEEMACQASQFRFKGSVEDGDADSFAQCFPNIQTLEIEQAAEVTGSFFSHLIRQPESKVRTIQLRDCEKVGPDLVSWAAARGVSVTIQKTQDQRRSVAGRKIRYDF